MKHPEQVYEAVDHLVWPPVWFVVGQHAVAPWSHKASSKAIVNDYALLIMLGEKRYKDLLTDMADHGSVILRDYFPYQPC